MKLDKYTVGKRYGKALFELAEEEQVLDSVFHDVQTLREVIVDVPELRLILNNPNVPTVEKQQLLHSLLQEMEEVTRHSFLVITENHRLLELPFIFDAFEFFDDIAILRGKREDDFAPVKNKDGVDSPKTAKELYEKYWNKMKK